MHDRARFNVVFLHNITPHTEKEGETDKERERDAYTYTHIHKYISINTQNAYVNTQKYKHVHT